MRTMGAIHWFPGPKRSHVGGMFESICGCNGEAALLEYVGRAYVTRQHGTNGPKTIVDAFASEIE